MGLFDWFRVLPRPSRNPVRNARRREEAIAYARAKIDYIGAGVEVAYLATYPRVIAKLYDKILEGIEELQELELRFPGLMDPHPDVLYAGIEKTKRIRLAETERKRRVRWPPSINPGV